MNFAEVKSLTIPEGVVRKITNSAGAVLWEKKPDTPTTYLTFRAPESFALLVDTPGWDGTMYYSTDAETWNEWDGSAVSGTAVYVCGRKNTRVTGDRSYAWSLFGGINIACSGNIETLLDWETVAAGKHPSMADNCYNCMFYGCTGLIEAPELPATTLASYCYYGMFSNCTGLTTAPALPATTLAIHCYYGMFINCTNLTQAPALPATTLADKCYNWMFYGCTSIKLSTTQTGGYTKAYRIPTSGTGTTATDALSYMFTGTGGTFTGTPTINTTYYLWED